jgi:hypothetical protein
MKKLTILFSLFILFACSDDENNNEEPTVVTGEYTLNPIAHVIEETSELTSTTEQIEQGIYIFTSLTEEISVGDIIVGPHKDGFLRKINGVTDNNGQTTFTTNQAYLGDLFVNSNIKIDFNAILQNELGGTSNRNSNSENTNTSLEGFGFELNNEEVSFPNGSATLNGYVNFDANYDFDFETSSFSLDFFKFNTNGTTLDVSLNSDVNINNTTSNTISQSLYSIERPFASASPPIFGTIKFDLVLALTYESSSQYSAEINGREKIGIEASINYENDNWNSSLEVPTLISEGSLTIDNPVNSSSVRLRLIPKIDILLYGVAATELHPEGFIGAKIDESQDENCSEYSNWNERVFVGVGGNIGVKSEILGVTLINEELPLPEFTANVWNAPSDLEIIGGNNQTLAVNSDSEPLTVRVLDTSGNPVENVAVYFEVDEISCGNIQEECLNDSLSNKQVSLTDQNGIASAIFNEALIDYDTPVTATIKDETGEAITTNVFFINSVNASQNVVLKDGGLPFFPSQPIEVQKVIFSTSSTGSSCISNSNFQTFMKINFCKLKNIERIDVDTFINFCGDDYWLGLYKGNTLLECFLVEDLEDKIIIQNIGEADNLRFIGCESSITRLEFHREN